MKFSHSEENRDGRLLDVLTGQEDGLRIIVSRLGAELISMSRINESGEWIGFLYRDNDFTAPSEGWTNHATVMGYYLHRLKNGSSVYRGREIKGGTHGFLRGKTWHLAKCLINESGGSLKYRIEPDDFSPTEYSLKVSVDLTFQIDANGVSVAFEFRNHESELTAHVSFGLHPGLVPLRSKPFIYKCRADCTDDIFRRAIICRAKRARLIFAVAKCPSPEPSSPGR